MEDLSRNLKAIALPLLAKDWMYEETIELNETKDKCVKTPPKSVETSGSNLYSKNQLA